MTWREIKKAAEKAGIKDEDEICAVQCEFHNGDKTFRASRMGEKFKLSENHAENSKDYKGCAA